MVQAPEKNVTVDQTGTFKIPMAHTPRETKAPASGESVNRPGFEPRGERMTFRPSNRSTAEANSISKKDRKPAAKGHSPKRAWISLASNASKNRTNSQVCKCAIRKPCTNLLSKHGHNSRAHMPAWNAGYLRCQGSPVAQGATPWTLSSSKCRPLWEFSHDIPSGSLR